MKRAAILIGVNKTGKLPVLRDAVRGARAMEAWAVDQKFRSVDVLTDEQKPVHAHEIRSAVDKIVSSGTYDQLVIYFAGHGVNIRYGEYWLLSDAPRDSQAAVNVRGSVELASYSGIPHVVLISDACRTAPHGIDAMNITGSEIFPNDPPIGLEQPVDKFFACSLGRPAHEIRDPQVTAGEFCALYTHAALEALTGKGQAIYEVEGPKSYLRPRDFKAYVAAKVAEKLRDLNLQTKVIQVPDAHIASGEDAWLAEFNVDVTGAPPASPTGTPPAPETATSMARELVHKALVDPSRFAMTLDPSLGSKFPVVTEMTDSVLKNAEPFGPDHQETYCGFKVRGATFGQPYAREWTLERLAPDLIRISPLSGRSALVLLEISGNRFAVLPAIPEFLTALTFEDGELVDVAYEPSANRWRWDMYQSRARELRELRAVASSATRNGVFRLDGEDALEISRKMQYAKGIDPALAIYAAYGYDGLGRRDRIREMCGYMRDDLGGCFFDMALLARTQAGKVVGKDPSVFGFFPLLAQGWALLRANRITFPSPLEGLERHLLSSVWTLLDAEGAERVYRAIEQGEVE